MLSSLQNRDFAFQLLESQSIILEFYEFQKPCELFCLKPSIFWAICTRKSNFSGSPPPPPPREFYHRFMYIAPSNDHLLLTHNLPFKVILRRFEIVFWCLEWECCTLKINSNPPILMALTKATSYGIYIYKLDWSKIINTWMLFSFSLLHKGHSYSLHDTIMNRFSLYVNKDIDSASVKCKALITTAQKSNLYRYSHDSSYLSHITTRVGVNQITIILHQKNNWLIIYRAYIEQINWMEVTPLSSHGTFNKMQACTSRALDHWAWLELGKTKRQ